MAVSTTGKYSGRQPAITALMAIFWDWADDLFGWTARGRNHARDLLSRRRDDREPVGLAALEEQLLVVVASHHRRKCRDAIRFLDNRVGQATDNALDGFVGAPRHGGA